MSTEADTVFSFIRLLLTPGKTGMHVIAHELGGLDTPSSHLVNVYQALFTLLCPTARACSVGEPGGKGEGDKAPKGFGAS